MWYSATRAPLAGAPDAVEAPRVDRRYVTAAMMLVMVLASMEQTVTSTAMPTIIGDLHGFERYSWVASIYLLACTVSMPLYGRLAIIYCDGQPAIEVLEIVRPEAGRA